MNKEYSVKVSTKEEYNEVITYLYNKYPDQCCNIETYLSTERLKQNYVHDTGNNFNYGPAATWETIYTYDEWKSLIEEKDWSGTVVKYKNSTSVYNIAAESPTRYRVSWGNGESVTYDRKQVNDYIKEGTWEIIETPKQETNMTKQFSVSGSKILKEAFIKQLELEGFEPLGGATKSSILKHDYSIEKVANKTYKSGDIQNKDYKLPQDWDAALEAFTKQEFQIGDIIYVHGKTLGNSYGVNGKIGKITSFNKDKNDDGEYNPIVDSDIGEISVKHIQLANKEQIKEYNKPKEKTVRMYNGDCSFDLIVRKGSVYYAPDSYTFTEANIEELREALVENTIGKYDFKASAFNGGCKKSIPVSSIEELLKTWDTINNG